MNSANCSLTLFIYHFHSTPVTETINDNNCDESAAFNRQALRSFLHNTLLSFLFFIIFTNSAQYQDTPPSVRHCRLYSIAKTLLASQANSLNPSQPQKTFKHKKRKKKKTFSNFVPQWCNIGHHYERGYQGDKCPLSFVIQSNRCPL